MNFEFEIPDERCERIDKRLAAMRIEVTQPDGSIMLVRQYPTVGDYFASAVAQNANAIDPPADDEVIRRLDSEMQAKQRELETARRQSVVTRITSTVGKKP